MQQPFTTSSPTLANYDWTDLADGTGIKNLYGCMGKDSTGSSYFLTQDATLLSNDIQTVGTGVGTGDTFGKSLDLDFDLELNIARQIRGSMVVQAATLFGFTGGSTNNFYGYAVFKLRKWDGTTETEIASVQSETYSGGTAGGNLLNGCVLEMEVPDTNIAQGESLRLTVELWCKRSTDGTAYGTLAHDPAMREGNFTTDEDYTTQLKIGVPFKIE